jgi:hypothetical protein
MPLNNPPDISLPESVFDELTAMSYDSGSMSFVDGQDAKHWLFVQMEGSNPYDAEWVCDLTTAVSSNPNPYGKFPEATHDIISGGTYCVDDWTVDFEGKAYRFRLEWDDAAGVHIVKARVF